MKRGLFSKLKFLKIICGALCLYFVPSISAASMWNCKVFSCYFFPLSQTAGGGHQVDNGGPAKMGIALGTPDFPLIFWGRPPQINFLVQESIPDDLTRAIVNKFTEGFKDLKLYESLPQFPDLPIVSVKTSKKLYTLQTKDASNSDIDLGISRYLKHNMYFFPYITRYKKVSELDFLRLNLKRDFIKKPPGQNIFITISEFDPNVSVTGDKDIYLINDRIYADYPKKIIAAFSKEPYAAEARVIHYVHNEASVFVQCDTRIVISTLHREIIAMIMHIHVRSKEWQTNDKTIDTVHGCVPLIFALPIPYKYASEALERIMKQNSNYFESPLLPAARIGDLVTP